jgi:peptide deformylase
MALRNIIKKGDELLYKKSRPVEKFDERLWTLLDDMAETMHKANGCGLAAVQVGILRRVVVIDVSDGLIELVNPEIIKTSGSQQEVEGCLSCPGISGITKRPMRVTVRAQDRHGKEFTIAGDRLLARAFCHEIDHLDGKLFVDKIIQEIED